MIPSIKIYSIYNVSIFKNQDIFIIDAKNLSIVNKKATN